MDNFSCHQHTCQSANCISQKSKRKEKASLSLSRYASDGGVTSIMSIAPRGGRGESGGRRRRRSKKKKKKKQEADGKGKRVKVSS
jgi:hypothetical protein